MHDASEGSRAIKMNETNVSTCALQGNRLELEYVYQTVNCSAGLIVSL